MYRCFLIAVFVVLMFSTQSAADGNMNGAVALIDTTNKVMVPAGNKVKKDVRAWVKTIKPAAGAYRPQSKSANYWETRVNRKRRSSRNNQ